MIEKLLKKIKELEEEIEYIKKKNEIVSSNIKEIFNECRIEKNKKEKFKTRLLQNLNSLKIRHKNNFNKGILSFDSFLELVDKESGFYLVIIDLPKDEIKSKYVYGFFVKKFSPIFTIKDNLLIGVVDKSKLNEIKKLKTLPFYNALDEEFDEIELFKVIFEKESLSAFDITKAINIFKDLRQRPSLRNKHFIEFSLTKNRVIDFEKEEIKKEKEKYSFIYEESYPSLEIKLKQNIDNTPFILTLLERIDKEIEDIKKSRGIINVVNRILNYIELRREDDIKKMVKVLREALKRENNLI